MTAMQSGLTVSARAKRLIYSVIVRVSGGVTLREFLRAFVQYLP